MFVCNLSNYFSYPLRRPIAWNSGLDSAFDYSMSYRGGRGRQGTESMKRKRGGRDRGKFSQYFSKAGAYGHHSRAMSRVPVLYCSLSPQPRGRQANNVMTQLYATCPAYIITFQSLKISWRYDVVVRCMYLFICSSTTFDRQWAVKFVLGLSFIWHWL